MHQPVLLKEVIEFLSPQPGEFFIDGTINGGGHAAEIFEKISPDGILLGIDWDEQTILNLKSKILNPNLILVHGNYADLPEILRKIRKADPSIPLRASGLLLDLGFSSEQLESSGRGFSFRGNEPLLMTYDSKRKPVKEILKELDEKELARIIFELSGEKFANRIASAIKSREKIKPIETSGDLNEIIRSAVPKNYERGRIEPATRTFQALRIYANDELRNLEKILKKLPEILEKEGRIAIISFHSLEDRLAKNNFRTMAEQGLIKILTKKPIRPSIEETRLNPRSRSAKLRAAVIN